MMMMFMRISKARKKKWKFFGFCQKGKKKARALYMRLYFITAESNFASTRTLFLLRYSDTINNNS
jgi:hypothetical protein